MSETGARPGDETRGAALLARISDASPDLLDIALLGADGEQIASSDGAEWSPGAIALWAAADRVAGEAASQIHLGTEEGEVFAVRGAAASIVATTKRFALASLVLSDLRGGLREFEAGAAR